MKAESKVVKLDVKQGLMKVGMLVVMMVDLKVVKDELKVPRS